MFINHFRTFSPLFNISRSFSANAASLQGPSHTLAVKRKIDETRKKALLGGGIQRIETQHRKGKLTARERVHLLCDNAEFVEWDIFVEHDCSDFGMDGNKVPGDSVITGYGKIHGRPAFIFRFLSPDYIDMLRVYSSVKISPFSVAALVWHTPGRSARSWTKRCSSVLPLLDSTTPAELGSRKEWHHWLVMRTSSSETYWRPVSFRKYL